MGTLVKRDLRNRKNRTLHMGYGFGHLHFQESHKATVKRNLPLVCAANIYSTYPPEITNVKANARRMENKLRLIRTKETIRAL